MISTRDALRRAEEVNLDLVEISGNATPPVCKIMDYGKFKFQQQKKAAEARKNQQVVDLKEISIRARTEEHDYQVKMKSIVKFLERGDKVKINMRFRGREIANQELGLAMMARIEADTKEIATVEARPRTEGRFMSMSLAPTASKK